MTTGDPRATGRRAVAGPSRPRGARRLRGWRLWSLPPRVLGFVLAVEALAVVLGLLTALSAPVRSGDVATVAMLALGSMVHLEAARHIERVRHHDSADGGTPYVDAKSMWSFAGLVLLSPGPAVALTLFTVVWWWLRVLRPPQPYRWVFSAATIVLGSCAALAVLQAAGPAPLRHVAHSPTVVLVLVAAALVRWTVNHGLVVAVISLSAPTTPWRRRLGSTTDNLIGMGALALGIALAVLVAASPWLVPVLLVPVLAMHRGVLLGYFAKAAHTDPKTGLATLGHWRDHAAREIARARRRGAGLGVLMVDLDEFKAINDRYGHLVGDLALRAVADSLRGEVRAYDAVGRFGGEEFVVMFAEVTPGELELAAERLRRRIGECEVGIPEGLVRGAEVVRGLTASVGAAYFPTVGDDLDRLLTAADSALLEAKRGGRNRVEIARTAGS